MCELVALVRRYFRNWLRRRRNWREYITTDRTMLCLVLVCVICVTVIFIMEFGFPFLWSTRWTFGLGSLAYLIAIVVVGYIVFQFDRLLHPSRNQSYPSDPVPHAVSFHSETVQIQLGRERAPLSENDRSSGQVGLSRSHTTEVLSDTQTRQSRLRSRPTQLRLSYPMHGNGSSRRARQSQQDSLENSQTPSHANVSAGQPRRSHARRSADVSIEIHADPDEEPSIPVDPSSVVNLGASTSGYSPDARRLESQATQPSYKKKRSVNTDQTDGADKTPIKGSNEGSLKSSKQSQGDPAGGRLNFLEKSAHPQEHKSPTSRSVTGDQSKMKVRFHSSNKGQKLKDSSSSKQHSMDMRDRIQSASSPEHASGSLAEESSFSNTENKIKSTRPGHSNNSESTARGPKERTPAGSRDRGPKSSNIPALHKRKKEASSVDVSAQRKNRSPSRKQHKDVPDIDEKNESDTSEEN